MQIFTSKICIFWNLQAFLSVLNIQQNLCHFTQMAYYNGKIHYAEHIDTDVNGENTLWERPIDLIYYTRARVCAFLISRAYPSIHVPKPRFSSKYSGLLRSPQKLKMFWGPHSCEVYRTPYWGERKKSFGQPAVERSRTPYWERKNAQPVTICDQIELCAFFAHYKRFRYFHYGIMRLYPPRQSVERKVQDH